MSKGTEVEPSEEETDRSRLSPTWHCAGPAGWEDQLGQARGVPASAGGMLVLRKGMRKAGHVRETRAQTPGHPAGGGEGQLVTPRAKGG